MAAFLPLLDNNQDTALLDSLSRIGPIIIPAHKKPSLVLPKHSEWYILVDQFASVDVAEAIAWLDSGADKIVIPIAWAEQLVGVIPPARLLLFLDISLLAPVSDVVLSGVSGVIFETCTLDLEVISTLSRPFAGRSIYVFTLDSPPSSSTIRRQHLLGFNAVLSTSQLTLSSTSQSKIHVADAFLASLSSDRPDGLFPTVVVSQTGHALGLVYSSHESVNESIVTGRGVYQSRKHGLWRKGETSGATQEVLRIRQDCDSDSLEFTVVQHGAGFCHLDRPSCFGESRGLFALESTLRSRLESAPAGSYTRRLFNDPKLLRAKIMEEAQELCEAESKGDIAFEAADLFYFALTKCIAAGVGIPDIEQSLDEKAKKVSRRPGNAKPANPESKPTSVNSPASSLSQTADGSSRISMRAFELAGLSPVERSQLLRRPVLKSDELFSKIKPIISDVRTRGDAAILELTAKFDKAKLTSTVIVSPFGEDLMRVDRPVREAIDKAYANIRKFHEAQVDPRPLVVETMPGVVCSRFARPVARVGLYIPGGTAVLPSTALMLGIPAQVAGCKKIVFATPPRPDGSISPEVVYVASLVGASAILKAGGAQAIAALAYGTESVPKVDKIFGPGNQWVTAAKMLVQNDTEALVSIDMPAGPSEVLVIADHTSDPGFVAADLLSQAEHGVDSQVVLVCVNLASERLSAIEDEIDAQARALIRVDIVRQSIAKSIIVKASSVEDAIAFSNDYAPEHLILHIENASAKVALVENAGSVFVGPYSPESCGDYASGTNHTLPTNGYARQFSGVNTQSFQKHITSQEITHLGLKELGPIVATLADCEGLDAHANAVRIRLRSTNQSHGQQQTKQLNDDETRKSIQL